MDSRIETTLRSWAWVKKLFATPPYLPDNYNSSDYARFMREETFLYTPRYAKQSVVIHGERILSEATKKHGAVLAPLHYGSFFLSSGAIVHQLKLRCTAIVTHNNLLVLPVDEANFWRGVHQRSAKLYRQPLFRAGITPRHEMERYLAEPRNLLWAMLDVREAGRERPEFPFLFLQRQIYLQTGPARLASFAGVPLVPICIQYNLEERRHHLYLDSPIWPDKTPIEMTQQALTQLEQYVINQPEQFFHDMNQFVVPHR
jgi:lauroyl/myristoyl acyltransferase